MSNDVQTLPLARLGEITQGIPSRFTTPERLHNAAGPPAYLLNIGDVAGLSLHLPDPTIEPVTLPREAPTKFFLRPNDVLITTRTRPPRAAVVIDDRQPMVPTQNIILIRPHPDVVHGPFLAAYLNTPDAQALLDRQYDQSAATPLLSKSNLETIVIPVPPLPVQHQIAALALAYEAEEQAALAALQERRALMYQAIRHSTHP